MKEANIRDWPQQELSEAIVQFAALRVQIDMLEQAGSIQRFIRERKSLLPISRGKLARWRGRPSMKEVFLRDNHTLTQYLKVVST